MIDTETFSLFPLTASFDMRLVGKSQGSQILTSRFSENLIAPTFLPKKCTKEKEKSLQITVFSEFKPLSTFRKLSI